MKVLVTGGAGRLGRSVVLQLLAAGHSVVSVDRQKTDLAEAVQVVADLSDTAATGRVFAEHQADALVHLAAIAVPFSAPEPEILLTNTSLAITVFTEALGAGIPLILAASSPTVIGYGNPSGWSPAYLPIDEDHPLEPWNAYSLSKQIVENTMAMFARTAPSDTVLGAFRPCFVVSPEEWAGAPTQQGHTIAERLATPDLAAVSLFNYIDARDAGDFVVAWLATASSPDTRDSIHGQVFFVGAADALCRDALHTAIRATGGSGTSADQLVGKDAAFSITKAQRLLGWTPTRTWRGQLEEAAPPVPADHALSPSDRPLHAVPASQK